LAGGVSQAHRWQASPTDAIGVGGGIGLGIALTSSAAMVVIVFLYSTATFHRTSPPSIA
jgi:hypothetical protein